MKCQVLINSREKLANIIDSFHYTKSTHNWPSGSLLLRVLKLKLLVFSCENIYIFSFWVGRFTDDPIFVAGSRPCVLGFTGCSFYAYLKIKGKVGVLMMRNAWSISNRVYSYALHQRPLCVFHNFTWHFLHNSTVQRAEREKERQIEKIIGLKSGWIFPFML